MPIASLALVLATGAAKAEDLSHPGKQFIELVARRSGLVIDGRAWVEGGRAGRRECVERTIVPWNEADMLTEHSLIEMILRVNSALAGALSVAEPSPNEGRTMRGSIHRSHRSEGDNGGLS